MPQIVPVSDFRADIRSVSEYTDQGDVVILTQNGRPKWAMIDYEEWNAAAQEQERSFARAIRQAEVLEQAGELQTLTSRDARERMLARKAARREEVA